MNLPSMIGLSALLSHVIALIILPLEHITKMDIYQLVF